MPAWPIIHVRSPIRPFKSKDGQHVYPTLRHIPPPDDVILVTAEGVDEVFTAETDIAAIEKWHDFVEAHSHG